MLFQPLLIISLFFLHVLAHPGELQSVLDNPCATGVHMIVARATTEQPGYGALGQVVEEVCSQVNGSTSEAVDYPANGLFNFTKYQQSETIGIQNMTNALMAYTQACPQSRIALLGYSQGAQVTGDMLCGRTSDKFTPTDPVPAKYTGNVRAILQLGDPSNVADLPWHQGNGTGSGIFPRKDLTPCNGLANVWQSWCDNQDIFCTSNGTAVAHLAYIKKHLPQLVAFIVASVQAVPGDDEL
ncbi:hypothetical protein MMC17_004422 [Xylographa soralifera]|nr:hypothetical protein [Xylographa soralifera]